MPQVPAQTGGPQLLDITGEQLLRHGPISAAPLPLRRDVRKGAARCPLLQMTPPVRSVQQDVVPSDCLTMHTGPTWCLPPVFKPHPVCRCDAVPRLSYSSVEGIFVELVNASPVRKAMQDVGRK